MNAEEFLQLGHINGHGVNRQCLDAVRRIGDSYGEYLATLFSTYDGRNADEIERHAGELGKHTTVFRKRSPSKNLQKRREIAAVGLASGAIESVEPIHIFDACGGSGILSSSIANLRKGGDSAKTSATSFDTNGALASKHYKLRDALAPGNTLLSFEQQDIAACSLQAPNGRRPYLLSKRPCGSNVDTIIQKVRTCSSEDTPYRTMMLCCCHAKAQDSPPFQYGRDSITVSPAEWSLLTRVACNFGRKDSPEAEALSRTAMRLVDTLRVVNLAKDMHVSVFELLDSLKTQKNHAIVLSSAA